MRILKKMYFIFTCLYLYDFEKKLRSNLSILPFLHFLLFKWKKWILWDKSNFHGTKIQKILITKICKAKKNKKSFFGQPLMQLLVSISEIFF